MRFLTRAMAGSALTAISLIGSVARAQALAPAAARYAVVATRDTLLTPTLASRRSSGNQDVARIGLGILGGFGGAYGGGLIGAATAGGCHGDMCTFGPALAGAAIGSVAMAALLSATPSMASKCSPADREMLALGGGLTGALAGGALGLLGGPLCILTYVVGAGVGAGVGASSC